MLLFLRFSLSATCRRSRVVSFVSTLSLRFHTRGVLNISFTRGRVPVSARVYQLTNIFHINIDFRFLISIRFLIRGSITNRLCQTFNESLALFFFHRPQPKRNLKDLREVVVRSCALEIVWFVRLIIFPFPVFVVFTAEPFIALLKRTRDPTCVNTDHYDKDRKCQQQVNCL